MGKRGLGRGLAALISDTMPEEREGAVREIPVAQIVPNPYQPRTLFDPLKMEELIASVREHGILQPVLVRRAGHERYQLVAGERRFRAAQSAGLEVVPALVKEVTEREQLEMAVVENVQREDIGVMEAARAYRRLMDEFDMTQEMVAQRVGKSRSGVANTVRLLSLPEEVQFSVERGEITEGHARALLTAEDEASILRAWQIVLKKRLSVRDTESLARDIKTGALSAGDPAALPSSPGKSSVKDSALGSESRRVTFSDPNEAALSDTLQQALGTKVTIRRTSREEGRIEIEFYSNQELDRLTELLIHGRYE